MKNLKTGEMAKLLGISIKTLQRWDNEGLFKAHRTPKGHRYYTYQQYLDYSGQLPKESKSEKKTVIYARVSSSSQKDDLANQAEFLKTFANARGIIVDEVITDIGSGLNYNRKKWNDLIDRCVSGDVEKILIAHKDRFIRFGYDWFARFLKKCGTEILIVNNDTMSPEQEMISDLIAIIHVFSCRIYGLRKYKHQIRKDEQLAEMLQDRTESHR